MPLADAKPQAERVLAPSVIPERDRTLTIGPFGRHVSFVYQQQRALATIWAIESAMQNLRGQRVAVIGGGLAGLTAATALVTRGSLVTLYEKEADVLTVQEQATHRYVHPTVNFWPRVEHASTTRFPFFDWHVGMCATIIKELRQEWDDRYYNKLSHPFYSTTVLSLTEVGSKVLIKSRGFHEGRRPLHRDTAERELEYDVAIVATGFGEERDLENSDVQSYWTPDNLRRQREREANGLFVVSGIGDGGLIEALRFLHRQFDEGRLPLKVIYSLRTSPVIELIRRAEEKGRWKNKPGEQPKSLAKVATDLAADYRAIAGELDQTTKSLLDESLYEHGQVLLVGRLPHPFVVESAPIHKLMIAYALEDKRKRLKYVCGTVESREGASLAIKSGTLMGKFKKARMYEPNIYIARHGPFPPIRAIVPGIDADHLRIKQIWLEDEIAAADWPADFFSENVPGLCIHTPATREFVNSRSELVRRHLITHYGYGEPELRIDRSGRCSYAIYEDRLNLRKIADIGGVDKQLFGTPLVVERRAPTFKSAARRSRP